VRHPPPLDPNESVEVLGSDWGTRFEPQIVCPPAQKVSGSIVRRTSCKCDLLAARRRAEPGVGPQWVHADADALAGWPNEKDLQTQAIRERLMGFEPTTFCMASRRSSQLSYSRKLG
jgi:hypothetical protein